MNNYESAEYYREPLLKQAHDIYSLFLIGALIGWLTIPLGSLFALLGYRRAQDALLKSHFRFQVFSSLWMIAMITVAVIGFIALRAFINPVSCPTNQVFMPPRWSTLFIVFYSLALYILWIVRFWRGYHILQNHMAVANSFTPWLPRVAQQTT